MKIKASDVPMRA